MDDGGYRLLVRVAVVLTAAWVLWMLYDSLLTPQRLESMPMEAAFRYLEDEQYEAALREYDAMLERDPRLVPALRGRAQALMQLGARSAVRADALDDEGRTADAYASRYEADRYYEDALAAYDEAIRLEKAGGVDESRRTALGVSYANRGILKDRMGDYRGALADYERSIALEPEVAEGPGFLTRFLRNQPEKPPAVDDRAAYLREQLAKPESERVLRRSEEDARQRAYKL
ncbi:MAG: hypothetical protein PVF91_00120 [Chromatiales bacterium]|jgi:tetratricopeptide (TPR) repeat protein